MATFLPGSGTLSMSDINGVFGRGNDLNSYRGTTYYLAAGGSGTFPSSGLAFSDFYGTGPSPNAFTATISSHNDQLNLRSWALSNGWNGSSAAIITLASGYYLYSSNIGGAALTIDGSWPGGLTFINNGYIMGCGGHGGGFRWNTVTDYASNVDLQNGGPAISMGVSCTIQNNSYIGGGGGGGAGIIYQDSVIVYGVAANCGGGGAGGGAGGNYYNNVSPGTLITSGGAGGGIGGAGSNGSTPSVLYAYFVTGGGGGRIMPGSRTASPNYTFNSGNATGGYGGEGGVNGANQYIASSVSTISTTGGGGISGYGGSAGGSGGAVAYAGAYNGETSAGGGGGGWGSSGGTARAISTVNYVGEASSSGASGGKCVNLNGYSITWSATGTRWGGIS